MRASINQRFYKIFKNGALLFALCVPSQAWSATAFLLDQFSVDLNGSSLFVDNFDDNNPPPSSPNYQGLPVVNPGYLTYGNFQNAESNGKLTLSVDSGLPAATANGIATTLQFATLQTPTNSSFPRSINSNDTFKISGLYDLKMPSGPTEQYRVDATDRVTGQGPNDTTQNVVSVVVMRADFNPAAASQINPATGQPFGNLTGQVVVALYRQDFVNNTFQFLEARPIDLTGNPDQIRLTLDKSNPGNSQLVASFTYVKNGVNIGTTTLTTPASAFQGGAQHDFIRPDFAAVQAVNAATIVAAQLITGSPASIQQNVSQVTSSSLQFQYRFATTSGFLTVTLNGVQLGVINAPTTLDGNYSTATFDTSSFVGLTGALLSFTLDGLTGSSIFLDNILFGNLANGDFQSGNLTAWTSVVSPHGFAGVDIEIATTETPIPAALPLFASGLGAFGLIGWCRKRKARDHRRAYQLGSKSS